MKKLTVFAFVVGLLAFCWACKPWVTPTSEATPIPLSPTPTPTPVVEIKETSETKCEWEYGDVKVVLEVVELQNQTTLSFFYAYQGAQLLEYKVHFGKCTLEMLGSEGREITLELTCPPHESRKLKYEASEIVE